MHIVTANEMYEMDRFAMEEGGLDGRILMENAGRAITEKIIPLLANESQVLILVGAGNNGGDGFVIGRTLRNQGYGVNLLQLVSDEKVRGDARYHKQVFQNYGGLVHVDAKGEKIECFLEQADVVIDAIFGIGIKDKLRPPFDRIIPMINNKSAKVISVDIPSGVPADEGLTFQTGVEADYTFIVEQPKMSAFLQHTADFYGKWEPVSIGLPPIGHGKHTIRRTWQQADVQKTLPSRDRFSHKGNHGRGLVIGGSYEMIGSVAMSAKAALRSGAGLLTVATAKEVIPSVSSHCAEATYLSLPSKDGRIAGPVSIDFSMYDGIAIGMGMGRDSNAKAFTRQVIQMSNQQLLIDADGIHHIHDDLTVLEQREHPTVLTPHLGEMSLLTGLPVAQILLNPFAVTKEFATRYHIWY
ncbi:NAD(P)H-hydrate epimerase [Aquibacillus salsiterrae]|uniref:NAD(P)H-hydrate epimerase n=1 Tax=Aquibacillus salsiterrae TaxID=2950439 RepID=A0A9X3WC40_9BACI|nr:NAD(P)H-hydrate epimerase [Aquibacillus salsiterrae]MDC3417032.1 NAD(P)H-hydrate epimerase [Aquibacillus salsiterrae]